jgi:uncharacterized protein YjaZ
MFAIQSIITNWLTILGIFRDFSKQIGRFFKKNWKIFQKKLEDFSKKIGRFFKKNWKIFQKKLGDFLKSELYISLIFFFLEIHKGDHGIELTRD